MAMFFGASSLARRSLVSGVRPASLSIPSTSVDMATPILPAFSFGGSIQTRNSTKRGGGSTKNNRNSPGKRLGYKKQTGQFVYPGQIIFRQRGTSWHAGPNAAIGKDHTIFATAPGYVHFFYTQPEPAAPSPFTPSQTASSSSSSSLKLPIKPPSVTTYHAKELTSTPHPSSKKQVRRYIAVSPNPETVFPLAPGTPRERRFEKIDLNSLQSQIDELKLHQQGAI
ncbi:ribosomal protein L27 [Testicularia cyperi]|uniref:Large ribosomal subunit protein bL27m n=1 Tax=Testicularia cyperi TaxID=1882483 RepID=A0A317XK12_9BASI|nr:ribosomal protein L27 [Testicularia cyperi]PWY98172.1 ribosomal protein L27 [Testicularia cyperi]